MGECGGDPLDEAAAAVVDLPASSDSDAGVRLMLRGCPAILRAPLLGLIASTRTPPDLVLPALDFVLALARDGAAFVGGFQSPFERECLRLLLRIGAPTVICPARSIHRIRLPLLWTRRIAEGRLAVASAVLDPRTRRPTVTLAAARNDLVVGLAATLLVPHATPGSRAYAAARRALERNRTVLCLPHPGNRDFLLLGATPARLEAPDGAFLRPASSG